MNQDELAMIILWSALIALSVGAIAYAVLRLASRASVIVHLVTIVAAGVVSVAGGMALVSNAMYISEEDVQVALAVSLTSGIVATVVAIALGATLARSARELQDAARQLGGGDAIAEARAATSEFAAIRRELVSSSERLRAERERAERSESARQDLVTRIAHDLLTPLASIRAQAEALEDGLSPAPERYLRQISLQVERLSALVGDLFDVSRIDAGTLAMQPEPVSLTDLASDVVAEFIELAASSEVDLVLESSGSATIEVDSRQLTRAIVNVLVNAIEHAPRGSRVTVSVTTDAAVANLIVQDEGPGVDPADIERIFEPGWRGSSARTPSAIGTSGGAGLGLAIARGIVAAHDGTITASTEAGGLRLTLSLPLHRT